MMGDPADASSGSGAVSDALSRLGVTTVEIDALLAFGAAVEGVQTAFADALLVALSPFKDEAAMVNFGGGGLLEGQAFLAPHNDCMASMLQFTMQAGLGLGTLAAGANLVALEYATGDTDSAALVAAVDDAFAPPPLPSDPQVWANLAAQERELDNERRANEEAFADRVDAAVDDIRDENVPRGGEGTFRIPYSDYYDTGRTTIVSGGRLVDLRDVAGEGAGAIPIEHDRQDVNQFDLPKPGDSVVTEDVDLFGLPSTQPAQIRAEMEDVHDSWTTDDPPGTVNDIDGEGR